MTCLELFCPTGQKLELKDSLRSTMEIPSNLSRVPNGYIIRLKKETQRELPSGLKQSFALLYSLRLDLCNPKG